MSTSNFSPAKRRQPVGAIPHHPGTVLALFGRETRYVVGLYLQRAFIFITVALTVVLSLDIASNLGNIMSPEESPSGLDGPVRLAYYVLLRAGYVLPSILPIAGIVGVVWAEFGLVASYERVMIFNSGQAHLRSLFPALLVGLLIGLMQFGAMAYIRPAAVEAQGVSHFRYYGPKFAQPTLTGAKWIAVNGAALNAKIKIEGAVSLSDIILYTLNEKGKLESITSAASAKPGPVAGLWTFSQGAQWTFTEASHQERRHPRLKEMPFQTLDGRLDLNPLWVEYFKIKPPLLAQSVLGELASGGASVPYLHQYQAAFHERFASIFNSIGMALIGAALSLLTFSPKMPPVHALKIGAYGIIAHIGSSILSMLGTYGNLPGFVAAWLVPLVLVSVPLIIVYRYNSEVQARLRFMTHPS